MERLVLIILLFIACVGGNASNNSSKDYNGNSISPAVRNCLKFSYDQMFVNENEAEVNFSDDFNLPRLRSHWSVEKSNLDCNLNERPGYLRLNANNSQTVYSILIKNTLSKKVKRNITGEAVSSFELANLKEGSITGLYFSEKKINFVGIEIINGKKILKSLVNGQEFKGIEISDESIMLRVKIEASKACFEYSIDGLNFTALGSYFEISCLNEVDNFVGIFCLNNEQNGGSVDVDWFYFKPVKDSSTQLAETGDDITIPTL